MKLAEALQERADLNKKIEQLPFSYYEQCIDAGKEFCQ